MADAEGLLKGLGGKENIVEIEPCITRLRTVVSDPGAVDDALLKRSGAHGVMRSGDVIQVVVGPEADTLAADMEDLME